MVCWVKAKPEQMILESFVGDGKQFCFADIGEAFVPPLRCQNREEL